MEGRGFHPHRLRKQGRGARRIGHKGGILVTLGKRQGKRKGGVPPSGYKNVKNYPRAYGKGAGRIRLAPEDKWQKKKKGGGEKKDWLRPLKPSQDTASSMSTGKELPENAKKKFQSNVLVDIPRGRSQEEERNEEIWKKVWTKAKPVRNGGVIAV